MLSNISFYNQKDADKPFKATFFLNLVRFKQILQNLFPFTGQKLVPGIQKVELEPNSGKIIIA